MTRLASLRSVVRRAAVWALFLPAAAFSQPTGRAPDLANQVEVRRTTHGIPHIKAENLAAAYYALAWVQLEDYGPRVATGLLRARGEMGRYFGRDSMESDFNAQREYTLAVENYARLDEATRYAYEGFAAGVNRYGTPQQTETARFWSDQTAVQWNRTLRQIATERGLNLGHAARLITMSLVSAGDAGIACWDAKFSFVRWRPVHAIQRADTDGNPATVADPAWQPLINANHPDYTSGHACVSTAVVTALRAYFHRDRVTFTVQSTTTGTSRTYHSLPAVLADVTTARIVGGLHFRYAMRDGTRLGHRVAGYVIDRHFRP